MDYKVFRKKRNKIYSQDIKKILLLTSLLNTYVYKESPSGLVDFLNEYKL